jgi:hypothetical protein
MAEAGGETRAGEDMSARLGGPPTTSAVGALILVEKI